MNKMRVDSFLNPDPHKTELFQSLIADYDRYAKGGWVFVAGALLRTLADEMQRTADEIEKAGRVKYEEPPEPRFQLNYDLDSPKSYTIRDNQLSRVYKAGENLTKAVELVSKLNDPANVGNELYQRPEGLFMFHINLPNDFKKVISYE